MSKRSGDEPDVRAGKNPAGVLKSVGVNADAEPQQNFRPLTTTLHAIKRDKLWPCDVPVTPSQQVIYNITRPQKYPFDEENPSITHLLSWTVNDDWTERVLGFSFALSGTQDNNMGIIMRAVEVIWACGFLKCYYYCVSHNIVMPEATQTEAKRRCDVLNNVRFIVRDADKNYDNARRLAYPSLPTKEVDRQLQEWAASLQSTGHVWNDYRAGMVNMSSISDLMQRLPFTPQMLMCTANVYRSVATCSDDLEDRVEQIRNAFIELSKAMGNLKAAIAIMKLVR